VVDADVALADLHDLQPLQRRAAVVAGAVAVRGGAADVLDDLLQRHARARALLARGSGGCRGGECQRREQGDGERGWCHRDEVSAHTGSTARRIRRRAADTVRTWALRARRRIGARAA
jgi:hypothetical protein